MLIFNGIIFFIKQEYILAKYKLKATDNQYFCVS